MDINRNNYQHFVTDWLDGTLATEDREAFAAFLLMHPDIREELEDLAEFGHLGQEQPSPKADFSSLKRSVNDKQVNKHNFLELVMASMDGELNHDAAARLEDWLEAHPIYRREADLFRATVLEPVALKFPGKESLLQAVTPPQGEELDALMIASLEGELTAGEQQKLETLLAGDAEAAKQFSLLSHTFLTPDLAVICPDKGDLKQRVVVPLFTSHNILRTLQVAASITLLAGIFLIQKTQGDWVIPTGGTDLKVAQQLQKPVPPQSREKSSAETMGTTQPNTTPKNHAPVAIAATTQEPEPALYDAGPPARRVETRPATAIPRQSLSGDVTLAELHRYNNPAVPPTVMPDPLPPSRLTIDEFTIEQIRYYTGGGNERPGFLADVSVTDLLRAARPYDRINNAGQQLYARWVQLKERAIDEVMPYR